MAWGEARGNANSRFAAALEAMQGDTDRKTDQGNISTQFLMDSLKGVSAKNEAAKDRGLQRELPGIQGFQDRLGIFAQGKQDRKNIEASGAQERETNLASHGYNLIELTAKQKGDMKLADANIEAAMEMQTQAQEYEMQQVWPHESEFLAEKAEIERAQDELQGRIGKELENLRAQNERTSAALANSYDMGMESMQHGNSITQLQEQDRLEKLKIEAYQRWQETALWPHELAKIEAERKASLAFLELKKQIEDPEIDVTDPATAYNTAFSYATGYKNLSPEIEGNAISTRFDPMDPAMVQGLRSQFINALGIIQYPVEGQIDLMSKFDQWLLDVGHDPAIFDGWDPLNPGAGGGGEGEDPGWFDMSFAEKMRKIFGGPDPPSDGAAPPSPGAVLNTYPTPGLSEEGELERWEAERKAREDQGDTWIF